eukprot:jgi/Ulvmu1/4684/UM002_0415.1
MLKHILPTLRAAHAFDRRRLLMPLSEQSPGEQQSWASGASEPVDRVKVDTDKASAPGADTAACQPSYTDSPEERNAKVSRARTCDRRVVVVLSDDLKDMEHVMVDPHKCFAACSCRTASKGWPCEHQVTYLLSLSPNCVAADRLIGSLMGWGFCCLGGCDEDDISMLSEQLAAHAPPSPVHPRHQAAARHVAATEYCTRTTAAMQCGAAEPCAVPALAAAHKPSSDRALAASQAEARTALEHIITDVRSSPANVQHALLQAVTDAMGVVRQGYAMLQSDNNVAQANVTGPISDSPPIESSPLTQQVEGEGQRRLQLLQAAEACAWHDVEAVSVDMPKAAPSQMLYPSGDEGFQPVSQYDASTAPCAGIGASITSTWMNFLAQRMQQSAQTTAWQTQPAREQWAGQGEDDVKIANQTQMSPASAPTQLYCDQQQQQQHEQEGHLSQQQPQPCRQLHHHLQQNQLQQNLDAPQMQPCQQLLWSGELPLQAHWASMQPSQHWGLSQEDDSLLQQQNLQQLGQTRLQHHEQEQLRLRLQQQEQRHLQALQGTLLHHLLQLQQGMQ